MAYILSARQPTDDGEPEMSRWTFWSVLMLLLLPGSAWSTPCPRGSPPSLPAGDGYRRAFAADSAKFGDGEAGERRPLPPGGAEVRAAGSGVAVLGLPPKMRTPSPPSATHSKRGKEQCKAERALSLREGLASLPALGRVL